MQVIDQHVLWCTLYVLALLFSVWQHIECMQVDPNNVPDKYMCEHCEPRPTDKKRARLIQLKKREDISGNERITSSTTSCFIAELEEEEDDATVSPDELHKVSRRKKRKVAAPKVYNH